MSELLIPAGMFFWQAMLAGLVRPIEHEGYLRWVRSRPCVISGKEADAHHLVGHSLKPVGGKVSDLLVFPLAPELHRPDYTEGLHRLGHKEWERRYGDQRIFVMQTLVEAAHRGVLRLS